MKIYKCDVCGAYFDPVVEPGAATSERPLCVPGLAGVAMSGLDVCPRCVNAAKRVNFKGAMLSWWHKEVDYDEAGNRV